VWSRGVFLRTKNPERKATDTSHNAFWGYSPGRSPGTLLSFFGVILMPFEDARFSELDETV